MSTDEATTRPVIPPADTRVPAPASPTAARPTRGVPATRAQWFRVTRLHALRTRRRIHSNRHVSRVYRVSVGVVGALVIVAGLIMVPLPGPGWLVVFCGIAVIASEFAWAHRLLCWARLKLHVWTHWLAAQPRWVGLLIGTATCVCVCACVWGVLRLAGIPDWVPARLAHLTLLD
jgi:uncharacterized protein (TIGR02611 family)